ncbi:MAG: YhjD/YihY/BrkB family envelope integrity protein [Bacteroidota bacterium]|nr:YhjD/YihY/BrkB family envelope integrity protein [Bacteroidota bacterium]|tara:strand:+ start:150 stop:1019 length:870 start_codon:yes stop_codon:yes gene_type:complete
MSKNGLRSYWSRVIELIKVVNVIFNASAITFNLFICAIPFTLILISIIGYILSFDTAYTELVRYGTELLPDITYEQTNSVTVESERIVQALLTPLIQGRNVLGLTGIIIMLFFTQSLFHSLKIVLFNVFDIQNKSHPIKGLLTNFLGLGLLGTVFLFFSLLVSFVSLFELRTIAVPLTEIVIELPWIYELLDLLLPLLFTFMLSFVIFRFMSERKISIPDALQGAALFAILFESAKLLLSLYLSYAITRYEFIYQGYTVIIVLAFWVFYLSILFVVSAILLRAKIDYKK